MFLRGGLARAGRHVRSPQRILLLTHHSRQFWSLGRGKKPQETPRPTAEHFTPTQPVRRHGAPDRQLLVHQFNNAIGMNDPAALHRWYHAIRDVLDHTPQVQPWLTRSQLLSAFALLALTYRLFSRNFTLIDIILQDMPVLHHEPVSEDVHSRILDCLLRASASSSLEVPHRYLFTMQERPGNVMPTPNLWNTLLRTCSQRGSVTMIHRVLSDMIVTGCPPTLHSYELLFNAINTSSTLLTMDEVAELVDQMIASGIPYDPTTWSILQETYAKEGFRVQADDVGDLYTQKYSELNLKSTEPPTSLGLVQELTQCAVKDGVNAAITLFQQKSRTEGIMADYDILAAILRNSHKLTEMRKTERALNVWAGPNARVWMLLIKNADLKGYAHNAMEVYEQAKRAGVTPTATLVMPVIHVLCSKVSGGGKGSSSEDALDAALKIYQELCDVQAKGDKPDAKGPSQSIYRTLARTLVYAQNQRKYFPRLMTLLDDMKSRKLPLDSTILAMIVVSQMRAAPSLEEAYRAYESLTQGATPMDAPGYQHVLHELCQMRKGQLVVPPINLVFDVVADARAAGHDLSEVAYILWLRAAGRLATALRDNVDPDSTLDTIRVAIRRVHDRLTIDATVTPTAFLWATLMDAYQRAWMSGEAMRVWDMMLLQGKLNEAAVSIMTDTCSHAGMYSLLQEIWTKLRRTRFPLNQRNWNNYVEALCRLNRLDQAVKVVCHEMDADPDKETTPNAESVQILLKYGKAHGRGEEIETILHNRLPKLLEQNQETV
jgi:pentatricopeptide repeat protein